MFVGVLLLIAVVWVLFSRLAGLDRRTRDLEQTFEELQREAMAARRYGAANTAAPAVPPPESVEAEPLEFDSDSATGHMPFEVTPDSDPVPVPDEPLRAGPSI